jgi:hypothetical protein
MIETTIRNPEKLETLRADSQGRINLGVGYAGRVVEIVVAESEQDQSAETGVQQAIGDGPMKEYERKGMLFVRVFGINPRFLKETPNIEFETTSVDPETVRQSNVDWSEGFLIDDRNVARFEFDEAAGGQQAPFSEQLVAEPVSVTDDNDTYGDPVYCYANEQGDISAVSQELVEKVQRMFGYDPVDELSNIRVHPDEEAHPVLFRTTTGDMYVAIAPQVAE